jgi:hypothetical protein
MKKYFLSAVLITGLYAASAQSKSFLDVPYIEVNGYADTLVTPNEIVIKILISESDLKNKVQLEEQEKKLVSALRGLGIKPESELTASGMQSDYRYYVLKQRDVLKSKEYLLRVNNAVLATQVFIELEKMGMANAEVVKVRHTGMEAIRNACRVAAVKNAHTRAVAMTTALQAFVGSPLHITDYSQDGDAASLNSIRIRGFSSMAKSEEVLPSLDFEKISVSIAVQVKFALK